MRRLLLSILLMLTLCGRAEADPSAEARSRLLVDTLIRYGTGGLTAFCVVGFAVSRQFEYRRFVVPQSFYARFVDGQFPGVRFNPPGCPTPDNPIARCKPSCGLITVFDYSAWGYPPPTAPWPHCVVERFALTQSSVRPRGKVLMAFTIDFDQQQTRGLEVIEHRPCLYFVQETLRSDDFFE